jgi:hypothetical protein
MTASNLSGAMSQAEAVWKFTEGVSTDLYVSVLMICKHGQTVLRYQTDCELKYSIPFLGCPTKLNKFKE